MSERSEAALQAASQEIGRLIVRAERLMEPLTFGDEPAIAAIARAMAQIGEAQSEIKRAMARPSVGRVAP